MQKRQLSRRGFLTLTGATGGAAVLAACAPVEAPVDQAAASDSGEAMVDVEPVTVRAWMGERYTPTPWTSRSAENPIVINAPRILAERYTELNPGTEIVYEEGAAGEDEFAWLTAGGGCGNRAEPGAQRAQFRRPERLGRTDGRPSRTAQSLRGGV